MPKEIICDEGGSMDPMTHDQETPSSQPMNEAMREAYINRALGNWYLTPEAAYRVAKAQQRRIDREREDRKVMWTAVVAVLAGIVIAVVILGLLAYGALPILMVDISP